MNHMPLDRATLDRVGAVLADVAPHQLPLIRAVRDGRITLVIPERDTPWPKRAVEAIRKPAILVLGDDDGRSIGPSGWRCANAAVRWPRSVLVHAAGGAAAHYEAVVAAALMVQRVLLVETDSEHVAEWRGLLERHRIPGAVILPPNGQAHPAPRPSGLLQ